MALQGYGHHTSWPATAAPSSPHPVTSQSTEEAPPTRLHWQAGGTQNVPGELYICNACANCMSAAILMVLIGKHIAQPD